MNEINLLPPCSYQGGKQRLAKQIVDIFYKENEIDENTKFYDLCCGSGAISLELVNRGIHPNNITMIDNGCYGNFWKSIANDEFDLKVFKEEINKLPSINHIQDYLKTLSNEPINKDLIVYHYLLLQSGSFGSKQIWTEDNKWKNNSFRNYWMPTETSNRRSPVNPMMPMPETLYQRVEKIVQVMGGRVTAFKDDVFNIVYTLDCELDNKNIIIYVDPPYVNTTKYKEDFNIDELLNKIWNNSVIYVSEGIKLTDASKTYLLSEGRSKGNISGNKKDKPIKEWLNRFN